ncbi:MAG: hypothetical protein M1832_004011 [Thelocarpon impressellum]|nr:MAG: hypothetical protein M1832_004011 [Thelocarpon impressellum]
MAATTPSSHSRTANPAHTGLGLKLTPSNSPFHRPPGGSRSPGKSSRVSTDACLSLKGITGTTTCVPSAFDCLPAARSFAYIAGAAAVLVRLDERQRMSQQFFRARPTAVPLAAASSLISPSTPTHAGAEVRNRTLTPLRDVGVSAIGAGSPIGDWGDSPSSKTWTARERIKAATCVALSPDGRFLALGETGYNPRVLIFSTASDAPPDTPVAIIVEHTFGVSAVAWSTDSRYLATLGTSQDGYLHVFTVNARTGSVRLHASNKCTSFVNSLVWLSRSTVVTAGTRHVKVWRIEEPRSLSPSKQRVILDGNTPGPPQSPMPRSLPGRNCLLGPLLEATFSCVARLSDNQGLACSQRGAICLIDDRDATQKLSKVGHAGFPVTCMAVDLDGHYAWIGGKDGNLRKLAVAELISSQTPPPSPSPPSVAPALPLGRDDSDIVAMAVMGEDLLTIDSNHAIKTVGCGRSADPEKPRPASLELLAHKDPVLGVRLLPRPNVLDASYFTWSSDGTVLLWDGEDKARGRLAVALDQMLAAEGEVANELRMVRASPRADFFATGDRYGVLKIISCATKESTYDVRAHSGEVQDIVIHQSDILTLVASCARDRTIQLFRKNRDGWTLAQTLNEHTGSVCGLLFADDGDKLLSCSGDRTIVVREVARKSTDDSHVAYLPVRTLSLKSTPVSMTTSADLQDVLVVSTVDRQVHEYDVPSGRILMSYRATDQDGNDAVVLDALLVAKQKARDRAASTTCVLAGVSTTDKSIRIYDRLGGLISREWGHTEGITSLECLDAPDKMTFISTGNDATIMTWEMNWDPPAKVQLVEDEADELCGEPSPPKEMTAARAPLRRVLSKAELAEFRRRSEPEALTPLSTSTSKRNPSPPRAVRKRPSKYSLGSIRSGVPLPPTPNPPLKGRANTSPALDQDDSSAHTSPFRDRSPSPTSQKSPRQQELPPRRPSYDARSRSKSAGPTPVSDFGSLNMSTEQVCRTLRAYRKKLGPSAEAVRPEKIKELEKELALTAKCLGERMLAARAAPAEAGSSAPRTADETALVQLLDTYSARLVEMIDERMATGGTGTRSRKGSDPEAHKVRAEEKGGLRAEAYRAAEALAQR